MTDLNDTAGLNRTVSYEPEATPDTDSDSQFDLAGINLIGGLIGVDISSGQPLVQFGLDENTNSVELDLGISGVLSVGVLSSYALIIEVQDGAGNWSRVEDPSQNIAGGVLTLDVLGLGGTSGTVTLTDLPAGEYRASLVPNPALISVGVAITRDISVTATDLIENQQITVGEAPTGNFITDAATGGHPADLEVTSVTFNGTQHVLTDGEVTVVGDHGSLLIHADGSYAYTPDTGNPTGGVDSFSITVSDAVHGVEHSANLNIDVSVQDVGPAPLMAAHATTETLMEDATDTHHDAGSDQQADAHDAAPLDGADATAPAAEAPAHDDAQATDAAIVQAQAEPDTVPVELTGDDQTADGAGEQAPAQDSLPELTLAETGGDIPLAGLVDVADAPAGEPAEGAPSTSSATDVEGGVDVEDPTSYLAETPDDDQTHHPVV